jgi:hypothetical protein
MIWLVNENPGDCVMIDDNNDDNSIGGSKIG